MNPHADPEPKPAVIWCRARRMTDLAPCLLSAHHFKPCIFAYVPPGAKWPMNPVLKDLEPARTPRPTASGILAELKTRTFENEAEESAWWEGHEEELLEEFKRATIEGRIGIGTVAKRARAMPPDRHHPPLWFLMVAVALFAGLLGAALQLGFEALRRMPVTTVPASSIQHKQSAQTCVPLSTWLWNDITNNRFTGTDWYGKPPQTVLP